MDIFAALKLLLWLVGPALGCVWLYQLLRKKGYAATAISRFGLSILLTILAIFIYMIGLNLLIGDSWR